MINESGLFKFRFHGLLPNKGIVVYTNAISQVQELLPANVHNHNVIIDRIMTPHKATPMHGSCFADFKS